MRRRTVLLSCVLLALGCSPSTERDAQVPPASATSQPSAAPDSTTPPNSETGEDSGETAAKEPERNVRFDEKKQMDALMKKALAGTANEPELRMLKAICMNRGDRACRQLTIIRLRQLELQARTE